ncbi:MAG: PEP-CTERM sorting domain-containing protein [Opitutae bacterium]|nr:PEP-CTERM sorting domain-containing protein [Opitutae bacterium]
MIKETLTTAAIAVASAAFAAADTSYYDTGYPNTAYTRDDFQANALTLSALDASLSGTYELDSIGYLMNSSTNTFASYVAVIDSSYEILALSSSYSTLTGQSFGGQGGKALATYYFSDAAQLSATSTYYVIFLSGTDGMSVGSTFDSTYSSLVSDIATIGGNYTGTDTVAAQTYTVGFDEADGSLKLSLHEAYDSEGAGDYATFKVGISEVTVVPEPSMFGLLAGIGALGIVAARRRRSRKA